MKLPDECRYMFEDLLERLCGLLPVEARPDVAKCLIAEAKISQDEEVHFVQRLYNMTWITLNGVFPKLNVINSKDILEEHLFQQQQPIFQQWSYFVFSRVKKLIADVSNGEPPLSLIPQEQLSQDMAIQFLQIVHNIFYVHLTQILPTQNQCKSLDEAGFDYLNRTQLIVDQLKLPVVTYLCNFMPEKDKPEKLGEMIGDQKLSQNLQTQLFQRLYNVVCLLSNEIFPNAQGKCHSKDELRQHIANPIISKVLQGQIISFLELFLQTYIEQFYGLLPEGQQPEVPGIIFENTKLNQDCFKNNADLQLIVVLYNVACYIKNTVIPRVKKIDSISLTALLKLGWDMLDDIKPLLEYLQPLFNQFKAFFIDGLYLQLSENDKTIQCGQLIPDDKLNKKDPKVFFTQKCYNAACFLFNQVVPSIENCYFSIGILDVLREQWPNFSEHFGFIYDLNISGFISINSPDRNLIVVEKKEGMAFLQEIVSPFFTQLQNFSDSVGRIILHLMDFAKPFFEEAFKFTQFSVGLFKAINAPVVKRNLGYYAACYVVEVNQSLHNLLEKQNTSKLSKNEQENVSLLENNLISDSALVKIFFGLDLEKNNSTDDFNLIQNIPSISEINFSVDEVTPFVPEEIQNLLNHSKELVRKNCVLENGLKEFLACSSELTHLDYLKGELTDIYSDYQNLIWEYEHFFKCFCHLPKTNFLIYESFFRNMRPYFFEYFESIYMDFQKNREPFEKAFSSKSEEIFQLDKNRAYIEEEYEKLTSSLFKPVQNILAEEKLLVYSAGYHQELNDDLVKLKCVKFPDSMVNTLPCPGMDLGGCKTKIQSLRVRFDKENAELISNLENELAKQKTYFYPLFEAIIREKISGFSLECQSKTDELMSSFEKMPESTIGESQYIETLKRIEDWIAKSTINNVIANVVQEKFSGNALLIQLWVSEFGNAKEYQNFSAEIKDQLTPLIQMIENQRVELQAKNVKEVENLKKEIDELQLKITQEEALKQAKALLPASPPRFSNKRMLEVLKKQLSQAEKTGDFEKIPGSVLNLIKEIDEIIGQNLVNLVEDLKQNYDSNKKLVALNFVSATFELLNNTPEKLHVLPSRPRVEPKSEEGSKVDDLKKILAVKQLKFGLVTLKTHLNGSDALFKKVKSQLDQVVVPNVSFKKENVLNYDGLVQYELHQSDQLIKTRLNLDSIKEAAVNVELSLVAQQQKNQLISTQITALTQEFGQSVEINSLSSLYQNITKQTATLVFEYDQFKLNLSQKNKHLNTEQQLLFSELEQAKVFQKILAQVGSIQSQVKLKFSQLSHHEYRNEIIVKLLEGKLSHPNYIWEEDDFYFKLNQSFEYFFRELDLIQSADIYRKEAFSPLEMVFYKTLDEKITATQKVISDLKNKYETKKAEWEIFSRQNILLKHSREISATSRDVISTFTTYEDRFLRHIELSNKNFAGVSVKGTDFRYAKLNQCDFSGLSLERVDISGADVRNCCFANANFRGVILDKHTQLDWKMYGRQILLDNLSDLSASADNLSHLMDVVSEKCPEMSGKWILEILQRIGSEMEPANTTKKAHLIAKQNRAVFVVSQLIPKLDSVDKVLELKTLVEFKHHEDKNPYGFIRRELDLFRFKYGNTSSWRSVMEAVQVHLNSLKKGVALNEQQYESGKSIMKTHLQHDYGFGWCYTPSVVSDWEFAQRKDVNKTLR